MNLIAQTAFPTKAAGTLVVAMQAAHRIAQATATAGQTATSAAQARIGHAAAAPTPHPPCVSPPSPSPKPFATTSSSAHLARPQHPAMQYQAFHCLLPRHRRHHLPSPPLVLSATSASLLGTYTTRPSEAAISSLVPPLMVGNARLILCVCIYR